MLFNGNEGVIPQALDFTRFREIPRDFMEFHEIHGILTKYPSKCKSCGIPLTKSNINTLLNPCHIFNKPARVKGEIKLVSKGVKHVLDFIIQLYKVRFFKLSGVNGIESADLLNKLSFVALEYECNSSFIRGKKRRKCLKVYWLNWRCVDWIQCKLHNVLYNIMKDFLFILIIVLITQEFSSMGPGSAYFCSIQIVKSETVSVLTDLMRKKETAEVFRERQAALGHTLPLGSFLLKPVQRILKYHLLLQNIVKHYDSSQVGYDVIVNALASMTGMAHHINDMKRKHEHAVRVQEIQSLLFGWEGADLTTFGELVAEGMFRIYGAKAIRHCSNLMLIESIPGEPLCFHVIPFDNPRIQYTLQSRSLEQKREWTLQLKRVILENYHAVIPYHARQLVMQLGQNRPEDELLVEKSNNTKRQHSAPEYLEKRKQERGRRKSESGLNRALRMRKGSGSKKSDIESPNSPIGEPTNPRSRSSSHEGSIDLRSIRLPPDVIITSPRAEKKRTKDKLFKNWRRKSEPGDVLSSKESLAFSPVKEKPTTQKLSLQNSPTCNLKKENGNYLNALAVIEAFLRPDDTRRKPGDETTDTENEDHSVERKPRPTNNGFVRTDDEEDPSSDYVTFFFTNKTSVSDVSDVSATNRTVSNSPYINVGNVWSNMNWLNLEKENATTSDESLVDPRPKNKIKMNLRRAQSFTSQTSSLAFDDQTPKCIRRSLRIPRPNRLNLNTAPSLPLSPKDSKKSDSLPRSFPAVAEDLWISQGSASMNSSMTELEDAELARLVRMSERPYTIASERPGQSDLDIDDFEKYIRRSSQCSGQSTARFPVCEEGNTTECTSTPGESLEDISNAMIHPEHRIYRPSLSRSSLRTVLANVSSRLIHLRSSHSVSSETGSCSNVNSDAEEVSSTRGREKERVSRRLMCSMAKVYSKVMKQNVRGTRSKSDSAVCAYGSRNGMCLPFYRQGSPAIGARMASPIDTSEYAVPRQRHGARKSEDLRPDSVLSESSNVTSSSDGDKTSGFGGSLDTTATPCESTNNLMLEDDKCAQNDNSDSDGSADSYYERSFEAIEGLLGNDLFRDSAIYSDPEEGSDNFILVDKNGVGLKMPPIKPRKPKLYEKRSQSEATTPELEARESVAHRHKVRGFAIREKLKHLEECSRYQKDDEGFSVDGMKSIQQRRKDLELWQQSGGHKDADESETSSQHSTSTINTVVELSLDQQVSNQTSMKGWVKHIVGKFQEKTKPIFIYLVFCLCAHLTFVVGCFAVIEMNDESNAICILYVELTRKIICNTTWSSSTREKIPIGVEMVRISALFGSRKTDSYRIPSETMACRIKFTALPHALNSAEILLLLDLNRDIPPCVADNYKAI
uniref:DH domain-containing protein n=1 Tax=Strigamia maritima TaxID=126957 RepID=T1IRR7_STRMM